MPLPFDRGFGDEGFEYWGVDLEDLISEALDVKLDRRFHIGEGSLIGVTFANDHSLHTQRVRDISIGMLPVPEILTGRIPEILSGLRKETGDESREGGGV